VSSLDDAGIEKHLNGIDRFAESKHSSLERYGTKQCFCRRKEKSCLNTEYSIGAQSIQPDN
jgi:hypothetical protein